MGFYRTQNMRNPSTRPLAELKMNITNNRTPVLLLSGLALVIGACTPHSVQKEFTGSPWVRDNALSLESMAAKLNELGSIGMSAPLLVLPDERFKFEVDHDSNTYFAEAKSEIQGRAAAADQEVSITAFGISTQVDPTQISNYGESLKNYQAAQISYLRQQADRDRATSTALDAKNRAARLTLEAKLTGAQKLEDPKGRADEQAAAYKEFAEAISLAAPSAPAAQTVPTAPIDKKDMQNKPGSEFRTDPKLREILPSKGVWSPTGSIVGTTSTVASTNRSALIMAAGDTAVEAILSTLHGPREAQRFHGKRTLFGVGMVSVTPGWRTREDFAARLTVRPTLEARPARLEVIRHVLSDLRQRVGARKLNCETVLSMRGDDLGYKVQSTDKWGLPEPAAVSAVSPMTDTQNLQLSHSMRLRKERALQFAGALQSVGVDLGAQFFKDYLKNLERDMTTSNREVPVAAFSTGNQFGYEVGPELWGLADPTSNTPKPAYRLVRQSFPTLFLLGFDDEQLRPVIVCGGNIDPAASPLVLEAAIRLHQIRRWVPLTEKAVRQAPSEVELVELMNKMANSSNVNHTPNTVSFNVKDQISRRSQAIAEELLGSGNTQTLPLCLVIPDSANCFVPTKPQATVVNPQEQKQSQ